MKQNIFSYALAAILSLAFVQHFSTAAVDTEKPLELNFTAVDGSKVDFTKLRGKVVLLDVSGRFKTSQSRSNQNQPLEG